MKWKPIKKLELEFKSNPTLRDPFESPTTLIADEPLIGVRAFMMNPSGILASLTGRGEWHKGKNVAQCKGGVFIVAQCKGGLFIEEPKDVRHEVPGLCCHCGFNAYYSLDDCVNHILLSGFRQNVLAVVRGWGNSRLHPDGWRSKNAEVLALIHDWEYYRLFYSFDPSYYFNPTNTPEQLVKGALWYIQSQLVKEAALWYDVPILTMQQARNSLFEFGQPVPDQIKPKAN